MRTLSLSVLYIILTLTSCNNSKTEKTNITVKTNKENNIFSIEDTIKIDIDGLSEEKIKTLEVSLNGNKIKKNHILINEKLGVHNLKISYKDSDKLNYVEKKITILNNKKPKIYTFNILNTYPHDINSYTQGLEFSNDSLYESTGLKGESKLRLTDYKTGEILKNIDLENKYFGEGLTVIEDNIYQLTWQNGFGFIYDKNTFEKQGVFNYGESKEGWGLTHNEDFIFKSDGTENIWKLQKDNQLTELEKIQVFTNKGKIGSLNELEFINGKIFANIYTKNGVAIINPVNGAVEGVIDFSPLIKKVTYHNQLDVLNGIAYHPTLKTIFLTGKKWDKLFEVEILEK